MSLSVFGIQSPGHLRLAAVPGSGQRRGWAASQLRFSGSPGSERPAAECGGARRRYGLGGCRRGGTAASRWRWRSAFGSEEPRPAGIGGAFRFPGWGWFLSFFLCYFHPLSPLPQQPL